MMMRIFHIALCLLAASGLHAQIMYTGTIGKYPVEVGTNVYSDGRGEAVYAYTRVNTPIKLTAYAKGGVLTMTEKDTAGNVTAAFRIGNYSDSAELLMGTWTDATTQKVLSVVLRKSLDCSYGAKGQWKNRELIQDTSLENFFFKLLLSKEDDAHQAVVTGVRIYEKKTGKLFQEIAVDCSLSGLRNTAVADYNFDGHPDFSLFEASYAGPNTTSLYFLYDPGVRQYVNSGFEGVSLEFDANTKTIWERNQCCAGATVTTAIYKVVRNKMILKEHHCYKRNEQTDELEERPWKECE
jgi:hypothetical protein